MLYLVTVFFLLALGASFYRDNRSLLNPALLIISLFLLYLSLAKLCYDLGLMWGHDLLYALLAFFLPLALLLGGLFLVYNGFVLLKREGRSKANLLSLLMGVAILTFFILVFWRTSDHTGIFYNHPLINQVLIFIFYSYFLFGFTFTGFMLYSYLYLFLPKKKSYDFIIIHGAGLLGGEKVTPLLKKRIDKAVEAYHQMDNGRVKLIASGGQGSDEKISEAQAISNYLLAETDVPVDRIILEDKSRTTYENLVFSKALGEKEVIEPVFLFVTNDYHVFRTSVYAKSARMKGDGLGCATASYYIPSAFIREFVAIVVKLKWLFAFFYLIFIFATLIPYKGILW